MIRKILRTIGNNSSGISWILSTIFLCLWLGSEFLLVKWGTNRLPIQQTIHNYNVKSDILFMGNSRVAAGIKPSVITQVSTKSLGHPIQSYNLGVGSTPFGIHYLLLKHVLQQQKTPKILIYGFVDNDLNDTVFFDDANLAEITEINDFPIILQKSLTTTDDIFNLLVKKISAVYRYRFLIREFLGKRIMNSQVEQAQIDNNSGGFQDFRNIVRKEAVIQMLNSEKERYETLYNNPNFWKFEPSTTYIQDFINLAFKAKIRLIFVQLPITDLHKKMGRKSVYKKLYFEKLKVYLNGYDIPLYDLSDVTPERYIPDTMHLSNEGATFFTEILFNRVIKDREAEMLKTYR